ncbi:unnamed protein product [Ilex paraguariensis]|uniref:Ycf15 n=1 Tax=Ilex paraguariensis TaxID=185542 RepID=A0ABC8RWK2_9AQUA
MKSDAVIFSVAYWHLSMFVKYLKHFLLFFVFLEWWDRIGGRDNGTTRSRVIGSAPIEAQLISSQFQLTSFFPRPPSTMIPFSRFG